MLFSLLIYSSAVISRLFISIKSEVSIVSKSIAQVTILESYIKINSYINGIESLLYNVMKVYICGGHCAVTLNLVYEGLVSLNFALKKQNYLAGLLSPDPSICCLNLVYLGKILTLIFETSLRML